MADENEHWLSIPTVWMMIEIPVHAQVLVSECFGV